MGDNWYEVLGVARDADRDTIRSAYRRRVKQTHPDIGGDPDEFRRVQRAWEVLSSDEGRSLFDAELAHTESQARQAARDAAARAGEQGRSGAAYARPGSQTSGPPHGEQQPFGAEPSPTVSARAAHATQLRARLSQLWEQLVAADRMVAAIKVDWKLPLSAVEREHLSQSFDAVAAQAHQMWAEALHLSALLGVDDRDRPPTPQLDLLFGVSVDEMGWDEPDRVWFREPFDLVRGPLWFAPRFGLRVRSAVFMVLVATLWWAGAASGLTMNVAEMPSLFAVVMAAGVGGAALWPLVAAVGFLRRLEPALLRRGAFGAVAGALAAGVGWESPVVGVVFVAAGVVAGVALSAAAPLVAQVRVWLWAQTIGTVVDRWRGRERRRVRGARRLFGRGG